MTRFTFAAAALVGLGAVACDTAGDSFSRAVLERVFGPSAPRAAPEPPKPAPAPDPPLGNPADAPLPSVMASRRFAGGRPVAWWSERLTRLRREGPEELYQLTAARARLNGLEVVEQPGGAVGVATAPATAAAAPPSARGGTP